ncbi:remodeling and spacing factor 1 [Anaeramoeba flamelloides]|uniref:Remodeling and spacing factor 1 n=1 Tax=Anaeramoeba flamelloides TaxID=1746091 RepID=A0ABQ8XLU7_9EUKA|nr:remodeling and spacing factor 1 [Anaeramoeba flamelloides]
MSDFVSKWLSAILNKKIRSPKPEQRTQYLCEAFNQLFPNSIPEITNDPIQNGNEFLEACESLHFFPPKNLTVKTLMSINNNKEAQELLKTFLKTITKETHNWQSELEYGQYFEKTNKNKKQELFEHIKYNFSKGACQFLVKKLNYKQSMFEETKIFLNTKSLILQSEKQKHQKKYDLNFFEEISFDTNNPLLVKIKFQKNCQLTSGNETNKKEKRNQENKPQEDYQFAVFLKFSDFEDFFIFWKSYQMFQWYNGMEIERYPINGKILDSEINEIEALTLRCLQNKKALFKIQQFNKKDSKYRPILLQLTKRDFTIYDETIQNKRPFKLSWIKNKTKCHLESNSNKILIFKIKKNNLKLTIKFMCQSKYQCDLIKKCIFYFPKQKSTKARENNFKHYDQTFAWQYEEKYDDDEDSEGDEDIEVGEDSEGDGDDEGGEDGQKVHDNPLHTKETVNGNENNNSNSHLTKIIIGTFDTFSRPLMIQPKPIFKKRQWEHKLIISKKRKKIKSALFACVNQYLKKNRSIFQIRFISRKKEELNEKLLLLGGKLKINKKGIKLTSGKELIFQNTFNEFQNIILHPFLETVFLLQINNEFDNKGGNDSNSVENDNSDDKEKNSTEKNNLKKLKDRKSIIIFAQDCFVRDVITHTITSFTLGKFKNCISLSTSVHPNKKIEIKDEYSKLLKISINKIADSKYNLFDHMLNESEILNKIYYNNVINFANSKDNFDNNATNDYDKNKNNQLLNLISPQISFRNDTNYTVLLLDSFKAMYCNINIILKKDHFVILFPNSLIISRFYSLNSKLFFENANSTTSIFNIDEKNSILIQFLNRDERCRFNLDFETRRRRNLINLINPVQIYNVIINLNDEQLKATIEIHSDCLYIFTQQYNWFSELNQLMSAHLKERSKDIILINFGKVRFIEIQFNTNSMAKKFIVAFNKTLGMFLKSELPSFYKKKKLLLNENKLIKKLIKQEKKIKLFKNKKQQQQQQQQYGEDDYEDEDEDDDDDDEEDDDEKEEKIAFVYWANKLIGKCLIKFNNGKIIFKAIASDNRKTIFSYYLTKSLLFHHPNYNGAIKIHFLFGKVFTLSFANELIKNTFVEQYEKNKEICQNLKINLNNIFFAKISRMNDSQSKIGKAKIIFDLEKIEINCYLNKQQQQQQQNKKTKKNQFNINAQIKEIKVSYDTKKTTIIRLVILQELRKDLILTFEDPVSCLKFINIYKSATRTKEFLSEIRIPILNYPYLSDENYDDDNNSIAFNPNHKKKEVKEKTKEKETKRIEKTEFEKKYEKLKSLSNNVTIFKVKKLQKKKSTKDISIIINLENEKLILSSKTFYRQAKYNELKLFRNPQNNKVVRLLFLKNQIPYNLIFIDKNIQKIFVNQFAQFLSKFSEKYSKKIGNEGNDENGNKIKPEDNGNNKHDTDQKNNDAQYLFSWEIQLIRKKKIRGIGKIAITKTKELSITDQKQKESLFVCDNNAKLHVRKSDNTLMFVALEKKIMFKFVEKDEINEFVNKFRECQKFFFEKENQNNNGDKVDKGENSNENEIKKDEKEMEKEKEKEKEKETETETEKEKETEKETEKEKEKENENEKLSDNDNENENGNENENENESAEDQEKSLIFKIEMKDDKGNYIAGIIKLNQHNSNIIFEFNDGLLIEKTVTSRWNLFHHPKEKQIIKIEINPDESLIIKMESFEERKTFFEIINEIILKQSEQWKVQIKFPNKSVYPGIITFQSTGIFIAVPENNGYEQLFFYNQSQLFSHPTHPILKLKSEEIILMIYFELQEELNDFVEMFYEQVNLIKASDGIQDPSSENNNQTSDSENEYKSSDINKSSNDDLDYHSGSTSSSISRSQPISGSGSSSNSNSNSNSDGGSSSDLTSGESSFSNSDDEHENKIVQMKAKVIQCSTKIFSKDDSVEFLIGKNILTIKQISGSNHDEIKLNSLKLFSKKSAKNMTKIIFSENDSMVFSFQNEEQQSYFTETVFKQRK